MKEMGTNSKEYMKEWRVKNRDKVQRYNQRHLEWQRENPDKISQYCRKWRQSNPDKVRLRSASKRAQLHQATLKLSTDNEIFLNKFYLDCPKGMEVDHVIPLRGRGVCGLHVPWNLQYLTPEQNKTKGNKLSGSVGLYGEATRLHPHSCSGTVVG